MKRSSQLSALSFQLALLFIVAGSLSAQYDISVRQATASVGYIAEGGTYNVFQAVDHTGLPNGGFYGVQFLSLQDHVYTQVGSTLGSVTGLSIYKDSPGNHFNAGIDFVNSLANGTAGHTIWALAQDGSNNAILRLSNGSGTGGLDGNGAQLYATASNGNLSITGNLNVAGSCTGCAVGSAASFTATNTGAATTFQNSNNNFIVNGDGAILSASIAYNAIQAPNGGVQANNFTGNGYYVVDTSPGSAHQVLEIFGGFDQLTLGSGGDGNIGSVPGSVVIATGIAGSPPVNSVLFDAAGDLILEKSGAVFKVGASTGISATASVRNSAGTGTCTVTFLGGIATATTC